MIIGNWPKPLSSLGAGWFVKQSGAFDQGLTALTQAVTFQTHYKNLASSHQTGDLMSLDLTVVQPGRGAVGGNAPAMRQFIVSEDLKTVVVLDPNPNVVTDPTAHERFSYLYVMGWSVATSLVLNYEAKRPRSEQVRFTLTADLQAVFTDPGGQAANFSQDWRSSSLAPGHSVGIEGPYGTYLTPGPGNTDGFPAATFLNQYDYFVVAGHAYMVNRDRPCSEATIRSRLGSDRVERQSVFRRRRACGLWRRPDHDDARLECRRLDKRALARFA